MNSFDKRRRSKTRSCWSIRIRILALAAAAISFFLLSFLFLFRSSSTIKSIAQQVESKLQARSTKVRAPYPSPGSYSPHPIPRVAEGEIQIYFDDGSEHPVFSCLDHGLTPPSTFSCHHQGGTQQWKHVQGGELKTGDGKRCLSASLTLVACGGGESFSRDRHGRLVHLKHLESLTATVDNGEEPLLLSPTSDCLTLSSSAKEKDTGQKPVLQLLPCPLDNVLTPGQSARWVFLNPTDSKSSMEKYDFNQDASRVIGALRSVPDIRHRLCEPQLLDVDTSNLLAASIIFCFVDEEYWALIRSIQSVLYRSPPELIGEIILVDDGSTNPDMQESLEEYASLIPKLRIIRTGSRSGLIKARSIAARAAKFEVLTFLDSHIEVVPGWLEPLLQRLQEEPKNIVTPQIVVIDQNDLHFQSGVNFEAIAYGQVNWDLVFHWAYTNSQPPLGPPRTSVIDPVQSPTMAGGLFAVKKSFFEELGSYDEDMQGWGGENIEISIRTWSCGHKIELIPCSIVGHIFRQKNPTRFPGTDIRSVLFFNRKRLVETWMDSPYKEIFYKTTPHLITKDVGDVSGRRAIRQRLHCKSFQWYRETMLPNLFPPTPYHLRDRMRIIARLPSGQKQCFTIPTPAPEANEVPCSLQLKKCGSEAPTNSFYYTKEGEIRGIDWPRITWCLMVKLGKIVMDTCIVSTGDSVKSTESSLRYQRWELEEETNFLKQKWAKLKHVGSGKCLAMNPVWGLVACALAPSIMLESVSGGQMSGVARIGMFAEGGVYDQEMIKKSAEEVVAEKDNGQKNEKSQSSHSQSSQSGQQKILETISVVLPCAGEQRLMVKTVESIFEATPSNVLKEVIVVDDGSTPPISSYWDESQGEHAAMSAKVRFMRHTTTQGLMSARTTGANSAVGDIVALLDCHVKPDSNWWRSVLREINENYKRVTVPVITSLDIDTWTEISRPAPGSGMSACYLTFDAEFKWANNRFWKEGDKPWVPMMSGGLLAMSKQWWDELGGYDPEMRGWGGENIDQSLRIWMCGGEIVSVQDSYIAHMWRDNSNSKTVAKYHAVGDPKRNRWRAASAWLGPFKDVVLKYPEFRRFQRGPAEDLSSYDDVKQRLHCKSFASYIERFSDIYFKSGVLPTYTFALESLQHPGYCLTAHDLKLGHAQVAEGKIGIEKCDGMSRMQTWHHANREHTREDDYKNPASFHSLRLYQSDQTVRYHDGKFDTSVAVIDGSDPSQTAVWKKASVQGEQGRQGERMQRKGRIMLQGYDQCLSVASESGTLFLAGKSCMQVQEHAIPLPPKNRLPLWKKIDVTKSKERRIYERLKKKEKREKERQEKIEAGVR